MTIISIYSEFLHKNIQNLFKYLLIFIYFKYIYLFIPHGLGLFFVKLNCTPEINKYIELKTTVYLFVYFIITWMKPAKVKKSLQNFL